MSACEPRGRCSAAASVSLSSPSAPCHPIIELDILLIVLSAYSQCWWTLGNCGCVPVRVAGKCHGFGSQVGWMAEGEFVLKFAKDEAGSSG